jgi:hypothetical protein
MAQSVLVNRDLRERYFDALRRAGLMGVDGTRISRTNRHA